jgi:hypothetical protein
MSTAPEVVAAYVAAGAAAFSAAVSFFATAWSGRRQRAADMIVAALALFEGGSQSRSTGIAALRALSKRTGWRTYRDTVSELFYSQLLYLFAHGRNRWESHEVANITAMADWLLCEGSLKFEDQGDKDRLCATMIRYVTDWNTIPNKELSKHGGTPDESGVRYLIQKIAQWGPILKGAGNFSMPQRNSTWIQGRS